jgi:hypothetical protein
MNKSYLPENGRREDPAAEGMRISNPQGEERGRRPIGFWLLSAAHPSKKPSPPAAKFHSPFLVP